MMGEFGQLALRCAGLFAGGRRCCLNARPRIGFWKMPQPFTRARFLRGAAALSQLPPDTGHEVAFAGRSNAGKSSALNALTGNSRLARTSKTPGRTQQINFFELDEDRRLVDLPGYGYARAPEEARRRWARTVEGYLQRRHSLCGVVVLMDIRRPFTALDRQLLHWCSAAGVPAHVLLTKSDKLGRGKAAAALAAARRELGGNPERVQTFSAPKRSGLDELVGRISGWLELEGQGPGEEAAAP